MKSKLRGIMLAVLMSLAMVFTMMPMMGGAAYAEDGYPVICLALGGNAPNIAGGQGGSTEGGVYFGNYAQSSDGSGGYKVEPIKWRVLDNKKDDTGKYIGELFLLSDQSLDCQPYHSSSSSITWKESTIRAWLNGSFMNSAFSDEEKTVVAKTLVRNKKTDNYTPNPAYPNMDGGEDTEDDVFLLSISEARNTKYGFTDNNNSTQTREAKNTDYAKAQGAWTSTSTSYAGNGCWWLRSPGGDSDIAAFVGLTGYVDTVGFDVVSVDDAVRPALNLNLKSLIFTSAAAGGKSSAGVGAGSLTQIGTNTTGEWKVTLKSGHDDFKIDNVSTCDGKTVNIKYSGAVAKNGEYISAIITDNAITDAKAKIKYYGNLIKFTEGDSTSGIAKVTIEGKMESTDKLYVINEQLNGDKKTDYSSALSEITIPSPTGHSYGKPTYSWNKEGGSWKCTATRVCENDSDHVETEAATVTSAEKMPATCEKVGTTTYTATFTNTAFTKQTNDVDDIPATGHQYGEWTNLDANQHQKVCEHDKSHVVKENHKWDSGKVTKKATEKATGVKAYTCTVCKATKTETIPKLKPSTPKVSGTLIGKTTAKGKTSLTFGWTKVEGAEGYDIFFAECNHSGKKFTCKNVMTIKGNNTLSWTRTGLKKGTSYKAYVKAYVMKNGKKSYVRTSPMMHAYTGGSTKNYTNAKAVTVNKAKVTLKKGKTFKIKAKVKKLKKSKKLMPKSHAPTLRYMTSNKKIATVSKSGKITAKGKGTCIIYVYAHNGVYKQIKVTVK